MRHKVSTSALKNADIVLFEFISSRLLYFAETIFTFSA